MKIDEHLLKFPTYIPNDIEGFMFTYPKKFPQIVSYFEEVSPKIGTDPKAYKEYGDWAHDELWKGFEKIKKDYEKGDHKNLESLVDIDQRFNKLFCYRFWVVNYLFADGPLHDFYVDNLKNLIRKFIDASEDVEDFEGRVVRIQRDLLQSDYADLYLRQALDGVIAMNLMKKHPKISAILPRAIELIDKHSRKDTEQINKIWEEVYQIIKKDPKAEELRKAMSVPLGQVEMRGSMLPLYNMLTHTVEFREENEQLTNRHNDMGSKIDDYKNQARQKLSPDEYELFVLSYEQARNFSMYKDIMGEIDGDLLPIWFGIHDKVRAIVSPEVPLRRTGHASMFYQLVWYLPMELKDKVFTPDFTPFSLETL